MRKFAMRVWVLLMLVTIPLLSSQAQPRRCNVDLENMIALLVMAQREADQGDVLASIGTLNSVQDSLRSMIQNCETSDTTLFLGQQFTSVDETFSFSYPNNWLRGNLQENVVTLSNTVEGRDIFSQSSPEGIAPGTRSIMVFFTDPGEIIGDDVPPDTEMNTVVTMLLEELARELGTFNTPSEVVVNGRIMQRLQGTGNGFSIVIYLLDYLDNGQIAMILGVSPDDEFSMLDPFVRAVAASFRSPPGEQLAAFTKPTLDLDDYSIERVLFLREELEDFDQRNATLSPDGTRIAWFREDMLCIFTIDETATDCVDAPPEARLSPFRLSWSPDSRYIAFTEEFYRFFMEPDIWLFDTENNALTNMTPDGVDRIDLTNVDEEAVIDLEPTWNPDGSLYFLRSSRDVESELRLYRIMPETGAVEEVMTLSPDIQALTAYTTQLFSLNGGTAFSPDGTQLALAVGHPDRDEARNGAWIVDLTTGEIRQVLRMVELVTGLPQDAEEKGIPIYLTGIDWNADGTALFLQADNPAFGLEIPPIIYHYDLIEGALTPLIDFSENTTVQLFEISDEESPLVSRATRNAVVAPGTNSVISLHLDSFSENRPGRIGIVSVDEEVRFIYEVPDFIAALGGSMEISDNGRILVYGYLFLPEDG